MDAAAPGSSRSRFLTIEEDRYAFSASRKEAGAPLHLRAADLGTYLLLDEKGSFVVGLEGGLVAQSDLDDAVELGEAEFTSPAEWNLELFPEDESRLRLQHRATGLYLSASAELVDADESGSISLYPASGCASFPELTLDAEGTVDGDAWDDGDVYGFADAHTHLFMNLGYGGSGMFHGAPFHRLGVEHALPDCERSHNVDGSSDIIAYAFSGELANIAIEDFLPIFLTGQSDDFVHHTEGYPTFTDWPNGWKHVTHQQMYYRWVERAYMAGLRLLVQHATSNSVLCELGDGIGAQSIRYTCNEMVSVDLQIDAAYELERYVDAQSGGPGEGWLRIVTSPAEARAVISEGKLALVLGIETSNLFDCFLTPPDGFEACDESEVRSKLDTYYERGIRVLFPVHKFDNAFSAGDGDREVGQLGSFVNTGHWSNFVEDCPENEAVFDRGDVLFGGLNEPRDEFASEAPNDFNAFSQNPAVALLPFLEQLSEPPLEGDYCQASGLTALGETLMVEMMRRGMIIDIDHLPRRAYARAYELLRDFDFPATATHGTNNQGELYELGGLSSNRHFGRCSDSEGAFGTRYIERIDLIRSRDGYPAEGFGFDLNGFAHAPRPRFGDESVCSEPQEHEVDYPFESYRGDVVFMEPRVGDRLIDFNTEGMVHIGLVAELIEEARRAGMSDSDLEPLFRSAEAYLRMWERVESRAAALGSVKGSSR